MGYRYRLGKFAKKDYPIYEGKTYEQLEPLLEKIGASVAYPEQHTQLYELGKYHELSDDVKKPFYAFDVQEYEYDFWILTKEGLVAIIKEYQENNKKYFAELVANADPEEMLNYLKGISKEWSSEYLEYLQWESGGDGEMTRSWRYEYAIFNLMHIYKTFDWENDFLIYSAW